MKKVFALIIATLMLALTGCSTAPAESQLPSNAESEAPKTEKPTLNVCMDMDIGKVGSHTAKLTDFMKEYAPEFADSYKLNVEAVPYSGSNRETTIDHIRVEMMAGKGPDLFLCQSPRAANPDLLPPREREIGLFPYPKAMMKRKMFLPLDDYIENAQHMEWDRLYPQIMEAGRGDEGQLILPLGWSMSFTTIDAEIYTPPENLPMTFNEMLQSDDLGIIMSVFGGGVGGSLGTVADYENDVPAFTEDELLSHLEGLRQNMELRTWEAAQELNVPGTVSLGRIDNLSFCQTTKDSVLIPQYNRDGGATARITCFGAVNINTSLPEAAFLVLDALLSKDAQRSSELLSFDRGAPVNMDLLQTGDKVNSMSFEYNGKKYNSWYLSDHNYQQLQDLAKQINAVDFVTPVHHELTELYWPYMQAETQEEREKLVHEAYTTIKMMLAES